MTRPLHMDQVSEDGTITVSAALLATHGEAALWEAVAMVGDDTVEMWEQADGSIVVRRCDEGGSDNAFA